MAVDERQLRQVYDDSLRAGYSPQETAARMRAFYTTGKVPDDPTEPYWKALIGRESRGDQNAVSPKGAIGRAQVMPATAPEAAQLAGIPFDEQAYKNDPVYNERIGRAYLRKQFEAFGGDPVAALAAYNAGPGAVQRSGSDLSKLPAETQAYVPAIMGNAEMPTQQQDPMAQAREIYNHMKAAGASPQEIKMALASVVSRQSPQQEAAPSQPAAVASQPAAQPVPAQPASVPVQPSGDAGAGAPEGLSEDEFTKLARANYLAGNNSEAGMIQGVSGLIRGGRQIYNQLVGDQATLDKLNEQARSARTLEEVFNPPGSGISGSDIGNVVGQGMATAPLALAAPEVLGAAGMGPAAAAVTGNAITGGVQGALQPTLPGQPISRTTNAILGTALGAGFGALGELGKGTFGRPNTELARQAAMLRERGIEIPKGADFEGYLPRLVRTQAPATGATTETAAQVIPPMFGMAPGQEVTNQALEETAKRVGGEIGNLFVGKKKVLGQELMDDLGATFARYLRSGQGKKGDAVADRMNFLREQFRSGRPMTGQQYQDFRRALNAEIGGGGPESDALLGIREALDNEFLKTLSPEEAARRLELNPQFRMLNLLRRGAGGGTFDQPLSYKQMATRLESGETKGRVDREARQVLGALLRVAPTVNKTTEETKMGLGTPNTLTQVKMFVPKAIAAAAVAPLVRSGVPAKIANSVPARTAGTLSQQYLIQLINELGQQGAPQ